MTAKTIMIGARKCWIILRNWKAGPMTPSISQVEAAICPLCTQDEEGRRVELDPPTKEKGSRHCHCVLVGVACCVVSVPSAGSIDESTHLA
jgi:hypothetical protein